QAIQHAHHKGIIHRDIKPSNVLVTMYDDRPVPKVIDFGVAKAVEQRLTEKSVYTQFGTLVGTFEYTSPEQAETNAFGVDPAWLGRGQNYVFLAMACQKLDRHDEARAWLAKVKPVLVELEQTIGKTKYGFAVSNYRGDWFALQVLLPEAEKVV